jgi:hypothetical protein
VIIFFTFETGMGGTCTAKEKFEMHTEAENLKGRGR